VGHNVARLRVGLPGEAKLAWKRRAGASLVWPWLAREADVHLAWQWTVGGWRKPGAHSMIVKDRGRPSDQDPSRSCARTGHAAVTTSGKRSYRYIADQPVGWRKAGGAGA
jgi:hypothetical protein